MLTDTAIRNAKPRKKAYKLFDGNGLFLLITPTGFKSWRYKYRFNNKERLLTIEKYSQRAGSAGFTLKEARKEHAIAYALIQQGKTFKEVATLWANYRSLPDTKRAWKHEHKLAVIRSLEKYVMPIIGDRVIHTITSDDIDAVLNPIQERGTMEVSSSQSIQYPSSQSIQYHAGKH